jgi:hypothetical protein
MIGEQSGGVNLNKRLIDVENIAGSAGDILNLSFWTQSQSAGGTSIAKIIIIHSDFATTGSKQEINIPITGGTHGWQQVTGSITATKGFSQLRVLLVYNNNSGSIWFDNLSFTRNGTEILINQSLEAKVPNGWKGIETTTLDQPDCTQAYIGSCSFKMFGEQSGGVNLNKRLIYVYNIAGGAGNILSLSFWNRTLSAGGTYIAKIVIIHSDFATTGSKQETSLSINTNTHSWEQGLLSLTATKAYSQLRVLLVYNNNSGGVWFDNLSFTQQQ